MMKVQTDLIRVRVRVGGRPIQEYNKDGSVFVEGREGSEFDLFIENLTGRKLLVHPSVDGISVITGKDARKDDSDHGYVLMPYQKLDVPGWRLDDSQVAQFFFAGKGKSYGEKTGRGENKGVIAVPVWEQRQYTSPTLRRTVKSSFDPFTRDCLISNMQKGCLPPASVPDCGAAEESSFNSQSGGVELCSEVSTQNLGAGFGERRDHQVQLIHFTPATTQPVGVAVIYYDNREGLRARGIRLSKNEPQRPSLPEPFPGDRGCAPPPGWNG